MANFIKVTENATGVQIWINLNKITKILIADERTIIEFNQQDFITVKETPEEIINQ